jgi:hypothetical protein
MENQEFLPMWGPLAGKRALVDVIRNDDNVIIMGSRVSTPIRETAAFPALPIFFTNSNCYKCLVPHLDFFWLIALVLDLDYLRHQVAFNLVFLQFT